MVWGDGTNVEMVSGNVGVLFSCVAETYGDIIVDLKLKEIEMPSWEKSKVLRRRS